MNKLITIIATIILASLTATAQKVEDRNNLKVIYINEAVSTHFVSPEKISYVDISINDILGDMPLPNAVRVKPIKKNSSGVITITSERFLVQYLLVYTDDLSKVVTKYNIPYSDVSSYLNSESSMTKSQLYDYSYNMLISPNRYYNISNKKFRMKIILNNIYTMDKYFFIDVSLLNETNIPYHIEDIRFKIEDKKLTKATNFQSIEVLPIMSAIKRKQFKKDYRNVFVFEKFTFPEEKVFVIEFSEKQISGRLIRLEVEYNDILHADLFISK